jgi:hypothetical protein
LKAQASATGKVYQLEQLRCGTSGDTFTADLPEEAGPEEYDAGVPAVVAMLRDGKGPPWNGLQRFNGCSSRRALLCLRRIGENGLVQSLLKRFLFKMLIPEWKKQLFCRNLPEQETVLCSGAYPFPESNSQARNPFFKEP